MSRMMGKPVVAYATQWADQNPGLNDIALGFWLNFKSPF